MKTRSRHRFLTALGAAAIAAVLNGGAARADVITDWNTKADAIGAEKRLVNSAHARGLAMMHVAMFEAVNAIDRRYAPYKLELAGERGWSKEAAAASAAYDILVTLYPDQKEDLDKTLAASLAGIPDGQAKSKGIELGKKAAAGIAVLRANDGFGKRESYRPLTTAGSYVPTVIPIESTAGAITPWVMTSSSQFRAGPPPALDSETWTKDVNEIRELGSRQSKVRTAEQTEIARFWLLSGPRTYNPIIRQVAALKKMDLLDTARLFALGSMVGADAFVAVFEAKYTYNFWRPITAIRNADLSHNKQTPRESDWLPLGDTPMHPEYPCAHCITSAAVSMLLQRIAGNEVGEITLTSTAAPGVTRKWTRLQDYSDEVANARTYAGFHYRFSNEAGKEMGRKIGELAAATLLLGPVASAAPAR